MPRLHEAESNGKKQMAKWVAEICRLPSEMLRVEECARDELGLTPQEQSLFDEAHEFADVDRTEEDALATVPLQVRGGPG